MPNRNIVVDFISAINPPLSGLAAEHLAASGGVAVRFDGGAQTRLAAQGPAGAAYLQVLEHLRQTGKPAYVEHDDEGVIVRLLMPLVVKLAAVHATAAGDLDVSLYPSQARHRLVAGTAAFAQLRETLASSKTAGQWLLVTADDNHEIIDVRPYPVGRGGTPPELPDGLTRLWRRFAKVALPRFARWWRLRICAIVYCPRLFTRCVTPAQAWSLFNMVAAKSCNPVTAPAPCIPFLYPDDGCWGRAHEMCRLIVAQGVTPAKIWIEGTLTAKTRNNPSCAVHWGWHVAPTLCVPDLFGRSTTYVIDPSLFTGPVTEATWKSVQGDPAATLTPSAWTIFYLWSGETDPTYAKTNQVLATYRNALILRSAGPGGPPPYASCP